MNQRDLRNVSTDEKKETMKSALFVDAVETLLGNKDRDTLQPGEAHIVIETEDTDDGLAIMMSCVASLSSANKVITDNKITAPAINIPDMAVFFYMMFLPSWD